MDIKGKKILILGMADSGVASAKALSGKGAKVLISDSSTSKAVQERAEELMSLSMECHLGSQGEELLEEVDMVVISPSVPSDIPLLKKAYARSIEIMSEIELAYRLGTEKGFIVAITGTNGKTTTTTLIGEMYKSTFPTKVAGNIGPPLITAVGNEAEDTKFVVELSSYQLENIRDFKADIAILLNITDDHLDRYNSFDEYSKAKGRIFENQTELDHAILNIDDPNVSSFSRAIRSRVFPTSKREILDRGAFLKNGKIIFKDEAGEQEVCSISDLKIKGDHNLDNAMAAVSAAILGGVPLNRARDVLLDFAGLKHRVEYVGSIQDVGFYDDSKATNPDAVIKALTAFEGPVILIAGGRNKGNKFDSLANEAKGKVKSLILIGESASELAASFNDVGIKGLFARDLEEAVSLALNAAGPNDAVLLSPACASFDMFSNYKEKGERFKKAFARAKEEYENGQKRS
ncbi:MAG: UDP-N-acetylmuramoyl-L-alanine--D-glutamate ligase [Actinomycetota bacterium]|nr:UDP-N-acetylmuramoyl-L-alanine--D-glutamate ligase [Actinomycetota bacterium]